MNQHNVAATHLTAPHLTQDQFADYVLGLSTETMDLHIEQCEACRAEVLAVQEGIGTFAAAGRAWSEMQPAPSAQDFRRRALFVQLRPVAAVAAAAALIVGVTLTTQHSAESPQRYASTAPLVHHTPSHVAAAPVPVVIADAEQPMPTIAEHHTASSAELAQDNAMMAAIDAEITAPFAVAPDVGHGFNGQ